MDSLRKVYELKYTNYIYVDSEDHICRKDRCSCNPAVSIVYKPLPDDFDIEKMVELNDDVWGYDYQGKMWKVVKKKYSMKEKMLMLMD